MRMRKRPNLIPRMEKCAEVLIADPAEYKGKWRERFPGYGDVLVELGCGKGRFTADTAEREQDKLLIAIECEPNAMVVAMERCMERGLNNVRFIDGDVAMLGEMFEHGEISRLYINFCDPWPKSRDAKLRLTAPNFLRSYADALDEGGEIHFKTDNTPLFDWSVEQFKAEGWELREHTHDLHENGPCGVMTDYEAKFVSQGLKINRVVAVKTAATKTTAAGAVARLRNASLCDARGYAESKAHQPGEEQA